MPAKSGVRLRDVTESDLPIFFEHQLDPAANHMAAFTARDPADRDAFMAHWTKILADDTITKKTILFEGQVAGNVVCFERLGRPEVGYWIGKEYWGKGIATQALAAFLDQVKVRPLYAGSAKDNIASLRVLEKCGFTIVGEDKGFANARGQEIEEFVLKLEANESLRNPSSILPTLARLVAAGEDKFGEHRGLGISSIDFKVSPQDSNGLFILENTFREKGGPARHLHYDQDEWFYAIEGEFIFEVGQERIRLKPGDSLLAPRRVPHVWAYAGDTRGRILIAFTPAGKMEAFFRKVTKANAMPPQDPELWRAHGMELLGPPLPVE